MTRKAHDVPVKLGFEKTSVRLSIGAIQPLHVVSPAMKRSVKYAQICASIRELGTIEPPAVIRDEAVKGKYIMLDGHLRLEAFKDLGYAHIVCLVATEDEAFTYNKHISRLATVQEHRMIMKAIERGVSERRIAKALNIRIETLRAKTQMLSGICPEAVELLKEKHIPMSTFRTLRRMAPLRQIEAAELMISMNNYSNGYATSLLAGTPREQLLESDKPKKIKGLTERQMELMEREFSQPRSRIQDGRAIIRQ